MSTPEDAVRGLRRQARTKKWLMGVAVVIAVLIVSLAFNEVGLFSITIVNLIVKFVLYAAAIWAWSAFARRLDARVQAAQSALEPQRHIDPPPYPGNSTPTTPRD